MAFDFHQGLIFVFGSTTDALTFEDRAKGVMPGRLIPVPRTIRASCGLAWWSVDGKLEDFDAFISHEGLRVEDAFRMHEDGAEPLFLSAWEKKD